MTSVAWQSSSSAGFAVGHFEQPHLRPFVVDYLQHLGRDAADQAQPVANCNSALSSIMGGVSSEEYTKFFAISTFCSRMISRRAICHDVPTRRIRRCAARRR